MVNFRPGQNLLIKFWIKWKRAEGIILQSLNGIVLLRKRIFELAFNTELSKMVGGISGIIGVLTNQGSVKEEHKIQDVKENFNLREFLENSTDIGKNLTIPLLSTAFWKIKKNLEGEMLSLGTRDPILYFLSELKKKQLGNKNNSDLESRISYVELYQVKKKIDDLEIRYEDNIETVYEILGI